MGTSVLPYRYRINGVVSTDKTVTQNMEILAGAAQSWINYDVNTGLWSVVINTTGNSIASFDDSNIIGGVAVQGTGLRDLYNSVRVQFPHVDLNDEPDFVEITIPEVDRNPNEPDNTLNIQFDVINDPVMAEMLGLIELKQSRVDRVITFTTDYSYIGLKAGDLIDVTNSMLGYTNKVFRIINLNETDGDDGSINIEIQALEYDANVYSTDDLYRYERTNENGIVTIGAIDPPTTPVITAREQDARPGVVIDTTVPSGVVDGIEFWFSTDGTNYALLSTEKPAGGGSFTFGDTVTYDYDAFTVTGNVYAKCRAINSTTSSDYSNVGSLLNFAPVQVTDAIGNNTAILNSSGVPIALLLALPSLLKGIDTFMGGNANTFSSVAKTQVITETMTGANCITQLNAMSSGYTAQNGYNLTNLNNSANWLQVSTTISTSLDFLIFDIQTPTVDFNFDYLDQTSTQQTGTLYAQPPLDIRVKFGNTLSTATTLQATTIDWQSNYNKIIIDNPSPGKYWVTGRLIPTADLSMKWTRSGVGNDNYVYTYNFANAASDFNVQITGQTFG